MNTKLIASLFGAAMIAGAMTSCEDGNIKKLKTDVALVNASAPLSAGIMGNFSKVVYDADNNTVDFRLQYTDANIDSAFAVNHVELCRPLVKLALNRGEQAEVLHQMSLADATARISYGNSELMTISADSIKAMLANPLTGREAAMTELSGYAALFSSRCPQTVTTGAELTGVTLNDSVMVYQVNMDGKQLSAARLKNTIAEMRHTLWNTMKAEAATTQGRDYYKLLFDNNLGVEYRFTGQNGEPMKFIFPYKEIYFLSK